MARIRKILGSKTAFIVAACLASVLLWLYVSSYENTTQEVTLTGLKVTYLGEDDILQDRSLLVTDKDMQTVSLTMLVKRSQAAVLMKNEVQVSVDLRDIRGTGVYERVYNISYPEGVADSDVTILKRAPETMTVNIDEMRTHPVEIRGDFGGSVADGYMREPIIYEPETVLVSGPEKLVSRVDHAQVNIDRENLTRTVYGTVGFTLVDVDGQPFSDPDLQTDVTEIAYTIPIVMVKDVVLSVELIDGGGATWQHAVRSIDPPVVTLSGDAAVLSRINQINLGSIDLASFAQSYLETFPIPLPNGVNNLSGEKEATVNVSIKGLATRRIITTNISFSNVSEGYRATAITQYKEILVRGPQEIVDLIAAENVHVVGDLTSIGNAVGRYSVPTAVYIDSYVEAGVVGSSYNVVVSLEPEESGVQP